MMGAWYNLGLAEKKAVSARLPAETPLPAATFSVW
jgi:hypothetical protein